MSETLPTGEQIRFRSSKTGEHNLDTYLEAAEIGDRQLFDMLDDLFDSGNSGLLRTDLWTFQYNTTSKKLQVRVGDASTPFTDITSFFNVRGAFSTSTTYQNFDLATVTNTDVYIVHGLSAGATFASEGNFTASANTFKLIDVASALSSATTQATNAASSASAASTSATNAATSATTATTKASEASTSATNAASSASGASTSASNASTSETNAASSASGASTSASNSASSASAASTSATNAAASATTAQNAAGTNNDGSAAAPSFSFSADTNTGLFRPGADQIGFTTGGTSAMTISGGDVGIGTSSPSTKLQLTGSANSIIRLEDTATIGAVNRKVGGLEFYQNDTSGGAGIGSSIEAYHVNISGDTDLRFATGDNTEAMRIDSSGNMLLGTSSATTDLAYAPKLKLSGTGPGLYFEETDTSQDYSVTALGGKFYIRDATAVVPRLTIDSSGNVGIGTASPTRHLSVNGSIQFASGGVIEAGTTSLNTYIGGVEGESGRWAFATNGSERMRIDSAGNVGIGITSPVTKFHVLDGTSSLRFRQNGTVSETLVVGPSGGDAALYLGDTVDTVRGGLYYDTSENALQIRGYNNSARMTIDSSGSVGVGTSAPAKQLHITKAAIADIGTLTDGATITPNFDTNQNFSVTLGGNRTLANPTNIDAGQTGSIFITQDGTGSRTLSFGSYWDFAGGTAPTLSTGAGAVDRIDYIVRTGTSIHAVATLNLS